MRTSATVYNLPFSVTVQDPSAIPTAGELLERYRRDLNPELVARAAELLDATVRRPMPGRELFAEYFRKHPEVEALCFRVEFVEHWELTGWRKESAEGVVRDWDDDLEELYIQLHAVSRLPGAILRWIADRGLEGCVFRVSRQSVLAPFAGIPA